jgi:hypothetical protein
MVRHARTLVFGASGQDVNGQLTRMGIVYRDKLHTGIH